MAIDRTIVPTELELHRAAAWWAGEGSVRNKDRKSAATLAQKEEAVCAWFLERFGGSVRLRPANKLGGACFSWAVSGDRARAFLRAIVDLLPESPRRQAQIRLALEVWGDGPRKTGIKPLTHCYRGHLKAWPGAVCKECSQIWSATRRAKPGYAARHREENLKSYYAKKEARA